MQWLLLTSWLHGCGPDNQQALLLQLLWLAALAEMLWSEEGAYIKPGDGTSL